jgi:hypothetical protein
MNELLLARLDARFAAADRLAALASALGGRLAELLASLPGAESSPLHESRDFLAAIVAETGAAVVAPAGEGSDPVDRVAATLGLAPAEVDALLLAGLAEEHEGFAGIFRNLHPAGEPYPTAGLAARLLCRTQEERRLLQALLHAGPAVQSGLLLVSGDAPFFESSLRLPSAVWPALAGIDAWPAEVQIRRGPIVWAGLAAWLGRASATRAMAALAGREPCTVLLTAEEEETAFQRAAALVAAAGATPARVVLPAERDAHLEKLVLVHALVRGAVPVLRRESVAEPHAAAAPDLADWPGPVVLAARAGSLSLHSSRPVLAVPVEPLEPAERAEMWRELLPELATDASELAARCSAEPYLAAEAAADLSLRSAYTGVAPRTADVPAALRGRAGLLLAGGVKLVRPVAGWDDLVVTSNAREQLGEVVERLHHQRVVLDEWGFLRGRRGARGVRMLLTGPPGTGKTLAAEVLARELASDLLVVDLASVVSKWIGETEKNLAEIFDAAERSQAVLLFDEADALFGKRTEVSDAHDRYANLETAYLLARIERFEGLTVLSTNLRQNIDAAFTRRLEFIVELVEPAPPEREQLWRCHLPAAAPLADDVDLTELATLFPVVGGVIRNAAVAAGFRAAADGGTVTRDHLIRSIRREYDKAGRAFPVPHSRPRIP